MLLPELLLLVQVCGTTPTWGADSLDCTMEDPSKPQQIAKVRLYGAFCGGDGMPVRVDSLGATAGSQVCFTVPDLCATYWLAVVNGVGLESCHGGGITVGVPTVGVANPEEPGRPEVYWYDLSGRRLVGAPTSPGWYWKKAKGQGAKKILVFVRI